MPDWALALLSGAGYTGAWYLTAWSLTKIEMKEWLESERGQKASPATIRGKRVEIANESLGWALIWWFIIPLLVIAEGLAMTRDSLLYAHPRDPRERDDLRASDEAKHLR